HPEEIIVAVAHYDVADTTKEGAMDDASGVGVVLELARIFAERESERTIIFLLTDSEEYGAFWGANAFVKSYEKIGQVVAVENFDFVSPEKQTGILTLCDGLKSGHTPLWLREIALNSIRSLNLVQALDLTGIMEAIERALQIPAADHGIFLAAGIPAFNWVGQTDNFPHVMKHYHHTLADTAEAIRPESMEPFGKAAERVINTINELPKLPGNFRDDFYWKLSDRYYLPGWSALCIQILLFLPFVFYTIASVQSLVLVRKRDRFIRVAKNESKNVGIVLGSLLLGYAIMLLLPILGVITQYEVFPATQKSLILNSPNFGAIFIVIASITFTFSIFRKSFNHKNDSIEDFEVRHAVHTLFLFLIILLAFLKNSYLAVLLLLPPAYFWTSLNFKHHRRSRFINGLLVLLGSVTFVAMTAVMTTVFHVGVFYWYIFLAASYGLFSIYAVVLFIVSISLMIRMFRSILS
ncbi:MAG: M28 family peptidase, partial [Bdellovibrionia bacterium]